ncbi:hypothetical protein [Heyndrickxia ginsengihumi]|uniref:hypothetical protein n=1 Tax=Heyndrickxia ginsengihumi TaxID=363870 RepID=UPI0004725399|nr:hypothetical protein [Heyndrickxia ginsengihumi]
MKKTLEIINNYKVEYTNGDHIYFLLDNDEVVYIGRTTKVYPPITNHGDKVFTHVSMPPIDSFNFDGTIFELFLNLILELRPKYNTVLPDNKYYMRKSMMKKKFDITGYEINRLIKKNGAHPVYLDYYDIRDIFRYD